MSFSIKDLEHIAKLCSLKISEEEKEKYLAQVDSILEYIWQLNEIDVEWIEPLTHPIENKFLEMREGTKEFEDRERLLKPNVKHNIKAGGIVIKSPIKS